MYSVNFTCAYQQAQKPVHRVLNKTLCDIKPIREGLIKYVFRCLVLLAANVRGGGGAHPDCDVEIVIIGFHSV